MKLLAATIQLTSASNVTALVTELYGKTTRRH